MFYLISDKPMTEQEWICRLEQTQPSPLLPRCFPAPRWDSNKHSNSNSLDDA